MQKYPWKPWNAWRVVCPNPFRSTTPHSHHGAPKRAVTLCATSECTLHSLRGSCPAPDGSAESYVASSPLIMRAVCHHGRRRRIRFQAIEKVAIAGPPFSRAHHGHCWGSLDCLANASGLIGGGSGWPWGAVCIFASGPLPRAREPGSVQCGRGCTSNAIHRPLPFSSQQPGSVVGKARVQAG